MQIFGKLFLTTFRIVAVGAIMWCLYKFVKANLKTGFLVCMSLILTGAIGNIIDSVFYGVIFNESTFNQVASFVPFGQGYAPLLYGKVVDMFYFPMIETEWPSWMPLVGGEHFVFFSPIFNFADSCISVGIVALLIFYGKYVNHAFDVLKKQES
jgi:signal peptidase II